MTQFHDQHSAFPDRDPGEGEPHPSLFDELTAPSNRLDDSYQMAHDVYMRRCVRSGVRGRLESRPSRFEPEDVEALRSLGNQYADEVRAQIGVLEGRGELEGYSIRTLHPAVFCARGARCRMLYAEIFDRELSPVIVSGGCVEHLPRGAAVGSLVYSWSYDAGTYSIRSVVSKAAFDELANRASTLSLHTVRRDPHASVLMGLVFENLGIGSANEDGGTSTTVEDIVHFAVRRRDSGVEFRFSVPEYSVVATSQLDLELLEPLTVVYQEFLGAGPV